MLLSRPDAAVFYSEDEGVTWCYSHCAPFAPFKAHRTATLADGTVVCWMTSHGKLRASWSRDGGKTWALGEDGKPWPLDLDAYGYPGGCVLEDESIFAVYYDAANQQQRTTVWGIRFRIDAETDRMEILPAPGAAKASDAGVVSDGELDVDAMK